MLSEFSVQTWMYILYAFGAINLATALVWIGRQQPKKAFWFGVAALCTFVATILIS